MNSGATNIADEEAPTEMVANFEGTQDHITIMRIADPEEGDWAVEYESNLGDGAAEDAGAEEVSEGIVEEEDEDEEDEDDGEEDYVAEEEAEADEEFAEELVEDE